MNKAKLVLSFVGLTLLICLSNAQVSAQKRVGGITISPAFREVVVAENKLSESFSFSVTNNTSEPHEFVLSSSDFGSLDESGGILFIGDAEKQLNYRYGLSSWITLERDRIVVEPKSTQKVLVTIENKESLAPGGHYGAVLLSPANSGERPTKVEINQVLTSLLFVKKQGGERYDLSLRSFETEHSLFSAPTAVDVRFQNAGNVHVVPRGTVTVTDPRGRIVKQGFINTGSALVLPETFRKIQTQLESVGTAWLPGTYNMSVAFRYDGKDTLEVREHSFRYVPLAYVIVALLAVITLVLSIVSARFRRYVVRLYRGVVGGIGYIIKKIFKRRK